MTVNAVLSEVWEDSFLVYRKIVASRENNGTAHYFPRPYFTRIPEETMSEAYKIRKGAERTNDRLRRKDARCDERGFTASNDGSEEEEEVE